MNAKHAADKIKLEAAARSVTGAKVSSLRAQGTVPAVLYGRGIPSVSLQVPAKDLDRAYRQAGESTLVYVVVDGAEHPTIIKDVARHPVSGALQHADFYQVRLDEKVKAMVPVVFTGESPAVKELQGIFVRNVNELEVEALPTDLPHEIEVDISSLKELNSQLTVGDIKGHGWTLTAESGEVIASVTEPISEEELKASLEAPTTDVSAVEEIKKEEKAEEGEEEAPAAAPAAEEKAE